MRGQVRPGRRRADAYQRRQIGRVSETQAPAAAEVQPVVEGQFLRPALFQARDGAGSDPRSALEVFGRDPRERRAADPVARGLPGLARHAQHRALSRPGMANDDPEVAPVGDMRQRLGLLGRQDQTTRLGARQGWAKRGAAMFRGKARRPAATDGGDAAGAEAQPGRAEPPSGGKGPA